MMPQKRGDDGLFGSSFLRKAASKQGPQGSADSQSGCMLTGGMYSRGSLAYQASAREILLIYSSPSGLACGSDSSDPQRANAGSGPAPRSLDMRKDIIQWDHDWLTAISSQY
jgi:hypothetical protein